LDQKLYYQARKKNEFITEEQQPFIPDHTQNADLLPFDPDADPYAEPKNPKTRSLAFHFVAFVSPVLNLVSHQPSATPPAPPNIGHCLDHPKTD